MSLALEEPRPEFQSAKKEKDEKNPQLPTFRVLVAEDDPVSLSVAVKQMELLGCQVTAVEDGQKALELLRKNVFDVILMDIQMPNMDGVEATRAIRQGRAGEDKKDIPIVAMTAYALLGDREKFLETGMNEYISKPVELEALKKVLLTLSEGDRNPE
ncbi:MAG: response regulator [Proteobacteria bacterium]|nr:response regulator [Pseudomonadota bacterium]MBU1611006.1 response regulator [Pseudomonadota bacterium]